MVVRSKNIHKLLFVPMLMKTAYILHSNTWWEVFGEQE